MNYNVKLSLLILLLSFACQKGGTPPDAKNNYPDIHIVGAMRNVMWKGELAGVIQLDTLQAREGLYGLGPESFLTGELLIHDGQAFVSRVLSDTAMQVEATFAVSAPFFVYGRVKEWESVKLPDSVHHISQLESFIDARTAGMKRPFAFKLSGEVDTAIIHIQHLPPGTQVRSPAEAHQGQTNYRLTGEPVEILGFFSQEHQGIFTHHDSFVHMHLITQDQTQMGHLDHLSISPNKMILYLPIR